MAVILPTLATCVMMASQTYSVPVPVILAILHVEGGRVGQESVNKNGTRDLGPMQVNTLWLPELAQYWRTNQHTARRWVRDDGCTNIHVGTWILSRKINQSGGNLSRGIASYHSSTPHLGRKYLRRVVVALRKLGMLRSYS